MDNVRECLPACVQQALGLQERLLNTHRLDEGGRRLPPGPACSAPAALLGSCSIWIHTCPVRHARRRAPGLAAGTEGAVVLARTRQFAAHFQGLIARPGALSKVYKCLTLSPPALGLLEHQMVVGARHKGSPKYTAAVLAEGPAPGSCLCRLRVLAVEPLALRAPWEQLAASGRGSGSEQPGSGAEGEPATQPAYEITIELITGAPHKAPCCAGALWIG